MKKTVEARTLKQWLHNNEAILIDVREAYEFAQERIPEAILQPLASLSLASLPELKNKKLVMQCKAGIRGEHACVKILAENPSMDVYNLEGGILAWKAQGLETIF